MSIRHLSSEQLQRVFNVGKLSCEQLAIDADIEIHSRKVELALNKMRAVGTRASQVNAKGVFFNNVEINAK